MTPRAGAQGQEVLLAAGERFRDAGEERARWANRNVAVILSGGNIERARFLKVLGGATPAA